MEWAFTHADIESFGYFEPIMVFSNQYSSDIYQPQNSAKIVKEVLLSFRKGESHLIDGFATRQYFRVSRVLIHPNYNQESTRFPEEVMVPAELDFRNKLQKQLHTLIGVMPRIDLLDGKHLIYYL